jgi:thioredoxin-like negative regulator of GroEL
MQRVEVTPAWRDARVHSTRWDLEIREPLTDLERKHVSLQEGQERFHVGDYVGAAKHFETAVAFNPEEPSAVISLVTAYIRLERLEHVVPVVERALKSRNFDAERGRLLRHQLANVQVVLGREDLARSLLRENGQSTADIERSIEAARGLRRR